MATLAYSDDLEQMAKELDFGGVKGLIKDDEDFKKFDAHNG